MQAIILAAGRGNRLRPWTKSKPKCLIDFGNKTLLEHNISILSKCGIKQIILVIGYLGEMIRERIGSAFANTEIEYLSNSVYEQGGSGHSLWLARSKVKDATIIMDADLLFDERILKKLLNAEHKDCLVVDRELIDTGEEVKVSAESGVIKEMGKEIWNYSNCVGEYIGIIRLSREGWKLLIEELDRFSHEGIIMAEYENAIGNMVKRYQMHYTLTDGLPWIEIDFPEDLEKARTQVYPRIVRAGNS